jgi:uncharacterized protein (DUF433 family)
MQVASINHIVVDETGVARLAGSRIKVTFLAVESNQGWTPEQILEQHPHLTLGKIYAALSYYHDHKVELDARIEAADRWVDELMRQHPSGLTRALVERRLRDRELSGE